MSEPTVSGHVIVCGLGHLGYRIADLLLRLGEGVVVITEGGREERIVDLESRGARIVRGDARSPLRLREAGIETARALVVAIQNDLVNIQIAVDARQLRPDLHLVVRLFDQQLARHLEKAFGLRAFGMSALAAPAFAAAAAGEQQLASLTIEGQNFVVFSFDVPPGSPLVGLTLRELEEQHRVSVLSASGEDLPPQTSISPNARLILLAAHEDWLRMTPGTAREPLRAQSRRPRLSLRRAFTLVKDVWVNAPVALRSLFVVFNLLIALSVFVFRFGMKLSLVDALYFVVTTVTTVGYGDYNLHDNGPFLKLYGAAVMVLGSASIATLYSILTDFVVSTRFAQLAGRHRVPEEGGVVVVVGLGNVGFRVLEELRRGTVPVVAVERDDAGPFVQAAGANVPVVLGDGRLPEILTRAGVARAHTVLAVTGDDAANLGVALAVRELNPDARTVVRVFDADFAVKVQSSLGLTGALSASLLAAPTFVAAALAPDVLGAVVHGGRFLVLASQVIPAVLAGRRPSELRAEEAPRITLRRDLTLGRYALPSQDGILASVERVIVLDSRTLS